MSTCLSIDVNDPEQRAVLDRRVEEWGQLFRRRNGAEAFLVEYLAKLSMTLDHLGRVSAARIAHHMRAAAQREQSRREGDAILLGQELIGPAGEEFNERNLRRETQNVPKVTMTTRPPELLVHLLESTSEGCKWLAKHWAELPKLFDEGLTWGVNDEQKAIRLLGMIPDVQDNAEVRRLCLARCAVSREAPPHHSAPAGENAVRPVPTKEEGLEILREFCARAIGRLEGLKAQRVKQESPPDGQDDSIRHAFDASDTAKELRRHQTAAHREMMKTIDTLTKLQKLPANADEPGETFCRACSARQSEAVDRTGREDQADRTGREDQADRRAGHALRNPHHEARVFTSPARRGKPARQIKGDRGLIPILRQDDDRGRPSARKDAPAALANRHRTKKDRNHPRQEPDRRGAGDVPRSEQAAAYPIDGGMGRDPGRDRRDGAGP